MDGRAHETAGINSAARVGSAPGGEGSETPWPQPLSPSASNTATRARRQGGGRFPRRMGRSRIPAFMPVATQGSVKGLEIEQIRQTGDADGPGNTYHLALRPGEDVVRELGGLHRFMGWDGPILTDSGGFQLFSLARARRGDRGRGRLPLAHRRPAAGTLARAGRGHPGGPGERRGHGAGPRRCAAQWPEVVRDATQRAFAGASLPAGRPAGRPGPLRHRPRAGWIRSCGPGARGELRQGDFAGYAMGG